MSPAQLTIGFPIFANATQLDFTGPFEVLWRVPGAVCHLLAHDLVPVRMMGGLTVVPTTTFDVCPPLDIVCVPGGPGHLQAMEDSRLIAFLRRSSSSAVYLTSVCTGSLVLAAAGLLRGYRATSHWQSIDRLQRFGAIAVAERIVVDRNRVTGGGVTAGIDFGLSLVARLKGETLARQIQLQIEYAPAPPFDSGDPRTADVALVEAAGSSAYRQRMAETDARAAARLSDMT